MARVSDRDGKPRPSERSDGQVEVQRVDVDAVIQEKERHWSGKLKKPTQAAELPVQGSGISSNDPFAWDHPALAAFVRDCTYEDGSRRTPGSFVVFVQDGMYTLCLTDKGNPCKVAFQAARTLSELFSLAEAALRADTLIWRAHRRSQR